MELNVHSLLGYHRPSLSLPNTKSIFQTASTYILSPRDVVIYETKPKDEGSFVNGYVAPSTPTYGKREDFTFSKNRKQMSNI
jgi:hypothetical protein